MAAFGKFGSLRTLPRPRPRPRPTCRTSPRSCGGAQLGEGGSMTELSFKASDYVLLAARMRVEARYSGPCAADDFRLADKWEAEARTKQLPSTRTEVGAGGELIDIENRSDTFGTVDTVANPDYVTAEASRDRLALANQAGSLGLALDAADTIQAQ